MQWSTLFIILKQAGYTGTISLEITDPNDSRVALPKASPISSVFWLK
jgi:hypothetical protein